MADFPAAAYEIVAPAGGAYAREKTVRRQQVEQGIFSISSNRGAWHAQTPALILCDQGVTGMLGMCLHIQLMYSGNFEAFVQKNQLNEVRVAIGINPENFLGS